jgi:hypothetical protein
VRDGDEEPLPAPCPRDRADELAALRAWVARHGPRVEATDEPLVEPVDGGAALHRVLTQLRRVDRPGPTAGRNDRGR